jgi:N-acetylglucosaminyldiphosphoundecaprenol N-acetyl-beta-D-mannosaminyltransferase
MGESIEPDADIEQRPVITWPPGPKDLSLTPGEVHVWAVPLEMSQLDRDRCVADLSEDERERAAKFIRDVHCHRFIAAHSALRRILAGYLGRSAYSLQFHAGPNGKPELANDLAETLHFNLAHSENLALIAVGTNPGIGVDVERVRLLNDFDELVGRFFSAREAALFNSLDVQSKPQAFFNLWTRKEAWLKAVGEGISHSLSLVEVAFLKGDEAKLLGLPPGFDGQRDHWSLINLTPAAAFTGAVAIGASQVQIKSFAWNGEMRTPKPQNPQRIQLATTGSDLPSATGLPIAIAGVRFDNVTMSQAVGAIEKMIASRHPHYLVTANVDFVVQAQSDTELRRILFDAHLVLCDGTPLLWASRLLGNPLPERVAGADIVPVLIRSAAERGYRLFFLGAAPDSLARAVENLRALYPALQIAGSYSPPFRELLEMDHEEIRRRVADSRADLLFVSLGCPKQEKWVAMNYRSLGVPVTIGVGATIDFLAGHVRRAPVWMQRGGLEWIYRLLQEPRRLYRRYSKDFAVFGRQLLAQLIRFRVRQAETLNSRFEASQKLDIGNSAGFAPSGSNDSEKTDTRNGSARLDAVPRFGHDSLKISGRLDAKATHTLLPSFEHVLSIPGDCFLDLSGIVAIDSTGVAMLMRLQRDVGTLGRRLVLLAPASVVVDALKAMQLDLFFDIADHVPAAEQIVEKRIEETQHSVLIQYDRDTLRLLWQGEITAANAEQVWRETHPQILRIRSAASETSPRLAIDLAGVRFIDSSGLGLMIRARKTARQNGVRIIFTSPESAVTNVVRLARLENWLFGSDENEELFNAPGSPALASSSVSG